MKAIITETTNGFQKPIFLIGIADDQGNVLVERWQLRGVFTKVTAQRRLDNLQRDIDLGLVDLAAVERAIARKQEEESPIQAAYEHFVALAKKTSDLPEESWNRWEDLSPEKQGEFEDLYRHVVVMRDLTFTLQQQGEEA